MEMHFLSSKLEIAKENRLLFEFNLSDKAPTTAPATAPAAPKPPEAGVTAAEVRDVTSAGRRAASENVGQSAAEVKPAPAAAPAPAPAADKPAEGNDKPAAGGEDLPDNEWSQAYYNLKEQLTANPAMQGPLSTLALAVLRLAAKYSNYTDLMPGSFRNKIWDSPEYKSKTLDSAQVKKVLDYDKKIPEEKEKAAIEELDGQIKAGRKLGRERASTRFVNNTLLGGITDIDDATSLAASLIHTQRTNSEGNPEYLYYSPEKNLDTLKAGTIAKGTILIFVPDMSTGEKVVAYATDGEGNFAYYNVGKKVDGKDAEAKDPTGVIDFKLGSPNCPVKQLGLLAVLEPNFERFAAAPETPPVAPTTPEKPATATDTKPETKEEQALAKIEKENGVIKLMVDEYPKNPIEDNLRMVKELANKNLVAAKATHDEIKAMAESKEFNVADLKTARDAAEAKTQATGASNEDSVAYVKAKNKYAEAEKIQGYWTRIKATYETAEANKKAADLLK